LKLGAVAVAEPVVVVVAVDISTVMTLLLLTLGVRSHLLSVPAELAAELQQVLAATQRSALS
jgi:hypothetical protein